MERLNWLASRVHLALSLGLLAGGAGALGCSNDNSNPSHQPPPITGDDASTGAGGKTGSAAGGQSAVDSGAGGTPDGAAGDSGGSANDAGQLPGSGGTNGSGGGDTDSGPACDPTATGSHPKACFPCAPSKNAEFLNHCTSSDCAPFDNAARLGAANWNDGKLIPLQ